MIISKFVKVKGKCRFILQYFLFGEKVDVQEGIKSIK